MQRQLEDFLRALRSADVRVTPSEAIDAHQAVAAIGYGDRSLFKDALCATLAKTEAEVARFDETFETFFQRDDFAPAEGGGQPVEGDGPRDLADLMLAGDQAGLAQLMEAAAQRAGVGEIRLSTQRPRYTRRLLDEMGLRDLELRIAAGRREGGAAGAQAERLAELRPTLNAQAARYVERQHELYAKESGRKTREELLALRNLADLDPDDIALMQSLVRRMAKRLAARYSRQQKKARKGKLNVGKTLRRSMGYGGVPFEVVWKTEKVSKPKIIAICDVSKSVAATAHFLLLFLYSLNEVVEKLDAFAFSGRMIHVGDILDEHNVEKAIAQVLKQIGFQQTDYGQALADFEKDWLADIDRRTTIIMLGDGRSNYANPRLDIMRDIELRSRAVIWLNPEPESYWGSGDSEMLRYRRFCHVAKTCNTLKQLERIIDDVLRTYVPK